MIIDKTEKLIKRYLKRNKKYRITLGFIVAFLLSCTSFAVTEEEIINKNIWLEGLGTEIKFDKKAIEQNGYKIEFENNNGGIKIAVTRPSGSASELEIPKNIISERTAQIINNAIKFAGRNHGEDALDESLDYPLYIPGYKEGLQLKEDNSNIFIFDTDENLGESQSVSEGKTAINKWIITNSNPNGQNIESNSLGINYGLIANSSANGQSIVDNSLGFNYGLITNNGDNGQYIHTFSLGFNYGLIANGRNNGQYISSYSQGFNYGLIANSENYGQYIKKNSQGLNYGLIANSRNRGQYIDDNSLGFNYGLIANGENEGQNITGNSLGFNYGLIANGGGSGQHIIDNSLGINYGIIANNGEINQFTDSGADAENYGILVNKSGKAAFGNVKNNGIILVQDNGTGGMDGGTNNGIIFVQNDKTIDTTNMKNYGVIFYKDKIVYDKNYTEMISSENKNIFDTTKDNIFINNIDERSILTLDDNLNENHITTIVGNKNTAVKSDMDNLNMDKLTMNKSSIVGYFEKEGTLFEFSGSSLNLTDSVISAIGKNKYTDESYAGEEINPTAIKFKNAATVTLENSNIIGTMDFSETEGDNIISLLYVSKMENNIDKAYKTYIENVKFGTGNDSLDLNFSDYSKINVNFGHIDFGAGEDKIQLAEVINMENEDSIYDNSGKDESKNIKNIRENIFILNEMLSKTENLETLQLADGENTIVLSYDNFGTNLAVEFDGTIKGGTGDDTFEVHGDMKTGGIDGGEGENTLTIENNTQNETPIRLAGKISNFENVNVNEDIKLGTNVIFDNVGTDNTINANNKNVTLDIDYSQKDSNNKVIGHALYDKNQNIKFENTNILIVDVLELTEEKEVTISHGEYDIKGTFEKLDTNGNSVVHKVKYGDSGDILINLEKDIPVVEGMENFAPIYSSLNDIYHSLISSGKLKLMKNTYRTDDGKTDEEAIKGLLEYYGKIYHSTPYAYSNEVSKKSAELITDSILENKTMPNLNKWIFGGNIAGREAENDTSYYGQNLHKVDIGKNEVSAESNIYGAYAFGEYGIAENQAFGFAVAGTKGDTDISGGSKLESNAVFISAYAKQNINNLSLMAGLGYQHSFYDSTRTASNDYQMTKIDEDYQDDLFTIFAGARYSYEIGNNIFIEPNAKLNISHVIQDDINEGDSSEDITIEVDKEEFTSMDTEVGLDIVKRFDTEKGSLNFKTGVSFIYAVDGYEDEFLNARVVGAKESFEIISPENDRTRVKFNLGAEYELDNGVIYNLHGNYITSSDSKDYSVGFGIGYKF